jgi:hypothetical protein
MLRIGLCLLLGREDVLRARLIRFGLGGKIVVRHVVVLYVLFELSKPAL